MPGRSRRSSRSQSTRQATQARTNDAYGAGNRNWVEPDWMNYQTPEPAQEATPTLAAVAREQGQCTSAETDASCDQRLTESAAGRHLMEQQRPAQPTPEVYRPHQYGPEVFEAPTPRRERVAERGYQHVDIGDGGAHAHLFDMGESGDEQTRVHGPHASVHLGQIEERDSFDEPVQYGFRSTAGLGGTESSGETSSASAGVNLNTPEATAEASIGERGLIFEAGGTAMEADGFARSDALGGTRAEYALGGSGRAGFRVPIEDEDGNGIPAIGLGISAGPARAQVTTELPFRAGRWLQRRMGWGEGE